MKAATSSRTVLAIAQAGRIASKSRSLFKMICISRSGKPCRPGKWLLESRSNRGSESALEPAFLQKPVVMPHEKMSFHLAHCIEQNPNHDQHARAAKKCGDRIRNLQSARQQDWNNGNDRQRHRTCKSNAAHCVMQIITRGLTRPNA